MRRLFIALSGCLLPFQLLATTPASPLDMLQRLSHAPQQQSFQGSFLYQRRGDFATWRVWHQAALPDEAGTAYERLLRLDGPAQELVQKGQQIQCASTNLREWLPLSYYSQYPLDAEQLRSAYELQFTDTPDSRVAGYKVMVVRLIPRDTHRYALELSIEPETNILLKSQLFDGQGGLLEHMQFLDFIVGMPSADELTPSRICQPSTAPAKTDGGAPAAENTWHVLWLPSGFHLLQNHDSPPLQKHPFMQMTYSDGFARFSVFLEPLQGGYGEEAQRQLGPVSIVSRRLLHAGGDWMVTVVGEIPPATAERIALSIRPPPPEKG